jgi:protein SCO1/2
MARMLRPLLFVILIGVVAYVLKTKQHVTEQASEPSSYGHVGEFSLTNQASQPFGSADLKGKVWIANFFFARCQGPCPLLTSHLVEVQKQLADIPGLHQVSISIDPENDQPAELSAYAEKYHANLERWTFLTGEKTTIFDLAKNHLKLSADENPDLHSTTLVLVDKEMNIRGYFDGKDEAKVAELVKKARSL